MYTERDAITATLSSEIPSSLDINTEILPPARYSLYYRDYLKHPAYEKYMRMHKLCLGEKGSRELQIVAGDMAKEDDPLFLSSAASAYLEAGIIHAPQEHRERVDFADKAELLWSKALVYEDWLQERQELSNEHETIDDITASYRIATNIACMPMMRSMFNGNVTEDAIDQSLEGLLRIGRMVNDEMALTSWQDNPSDHSMWYGLSYELNTLIALLYKRDPRFIAIPSFHRAGTGYYYPDQTHDIELISQHYGSVRAIIPIEVKAKVRSRNRKRYRSLLVSGREHLQLTDECNPVTTYEAYAQCKESSMPPQESLHIVEETQMAVRSLLAHYKQTGRDKTLVRRNSPTTYYHGTYRRTA